MRAFTHPTRDLGRKLPRALQTIQIIPISFSGLPRKLRILPVFEHFDQPPVEKQSQSEPASGEPALSVTITLPVNVDFDPIRY